jgi:lanosterol synthase
VRAAAYPPTAHGNPDEVSSFTPKLISKQHIHDTVDVVLSLQNSDGWFASYELIRGPQFLELLNPAEVFGT